jgi:hypothetical protein
MSAAERKCAPRSAQLRTNIYRSLRQKSLKALCDHEFLLQLLSQVSGYKEGT